MEAADKRISHVASLTEDLVRCILALLPPLSLVQVRSVCRSWNRIVVSQSAAGVQMAWCLFCRRMQRALSSGGSEMVTQCRAFDPVSCRWFEIALPTAPHRDVHLRMSTGGYSGLVVLQEYRRGTPLLHYWVGNPLLRRWHQVGHPVAEGKPTYFCLRYTLHELIVDEHSKVFKILRFETSYLKPSHTWCCMARVYDSKTKEWRRGATFTTDSGINGGLVVHHRATTVSKGIVYFLCTTRTCNIGVLGYLVEQDRFEVIVPPSRVPRGHAAVCWKEVRLIVDESLDRQHTLPALLVGDAAYEGRRLPEYSVFLCADRVRIMEFDPGSKVWIADESSGLNLKEIRKTRGGHGSFGCAGGLKTLYLAVCSDTDPAIVMHNSATRVWTHLPTDPAQARPLGGWGDFSFGSFVPRLDVEPLPHQAH